MKFSLEIFQLTCCLELLNRVFDHISHYFSKFYPTTSLLFKKIEKITIFFRNVAKICKFYNDQK